MPDICFSDFNKVSASYASFSSPMFLVEDSESCSTVSHDSSSPFSIVSMEFSDVTSDSTFRRNDSFASKTNPAVKISGIVFLETNFLSQ